MSTSCNIREDRKPIRIKQSVFINLCMDIGESIALKLTYGHEIHRRVLNEIDSSKNIDYNILLKNDPQIRAILEILQLKKILTNDPKLVFIPSK